MAKADENQTWMCLFEKVPLTVHEPEAGTQRPSLQVTNGLDFSITSLALDLDLASEALNKRIEHSVVVPFPTSLQPGEVRTVELWLPAKTEAVLLSGDVAIRAAPANVLDGEERRLILREDLGPSFRVFWPTQLKSTMDCR